jgi:TetR/AcrR family transcriptional repressor of nem operon
MVARDKAETVIDRSFQLNQSLGMSRQRQFDPNVVLDSAMAVFWRKGFEGSSLSDLVEATGVQRQSLYNAFADKRGLFASVLERYREHVRLSLQPLESGKARMADVRRYIASVLRDQGKGGFGACLLVKTAFADEVADPEIRRSVQEGARAVRSAFARVVSQCVEAGELPVETDPARTASLLYAVLNGMSALAQTGGSATHAEHILDHTFASLKVGDT